MLLCLLAFTHIRDAVAFTDSCHGDISVIGRLEEGKQTNTKCRVYRRISSSLIRIWILYRRRNDRFKEDFLFWAEKHIEQIKEQRSSDFLHRLTRTPACEKGKKLFSVFRASSSLDWPPLDHSDVNTVSCCFHAAWRLTRRNFEPYPVVSSSFKTCSPSPEGLIVFIAVFII